MARPSRSAMYADDATFLWKPILRFLAILLAIVGIGTTAWVMVSHLHKPISTTGPYGSDDYGYDYDYQDFYPTVYLPWQFITLGLSILWNIANIITLLARNRAIHPGANVACDLILWLGLLITGGFATLGSVTYFYYSPDDDYYDGDLGYGGGTYSNGTQYEYTANGTIIPVTDSASQCGDFTSCAARDQFVSAVQHRGVVIAVGAAMAFLVLLFHFALFISACRYTNDRRRSVTSRQARAITTEATEIARKMIADMTGPNGGFVPINQAQQGGNYQPLQQNDAGEAMEMRQRQNRAQPGYDYQPVQQGEMGDGRGEQISPEEEMQRRYEQASPSFPTGESSLAAQRRARQRTVNVPDEDVHPALRDDPDVVSHAV